MPRVHHRKAAKDYPDHGIAKGEMYYTWSIKMQRGGIVRKSKTYPRPSQLTLSPFLGPLGDLQQDLPNADSADALREFADQLRELGEEAQGSFDNMPEGLQQGDTGQMLEERAQNCESWADEIEQAADNLEQKLKEIDGYGPDDLGLDDDADPDEIETAKQEARDEALSEHVEEACGADPF